MFALETGSVIAGRYRLDRALARGGMGSVWVGRHLQLDVPIAVKFMDASYADSAEASARFEREAKACARLKSPHIIQVHDYGVEEGTLYIVMELLDGEDLGARLKRVSRLSPAAAAPIAVQIGKALRTAHEAGIVHRDLKPGNVFLCRHQDEEIVKVLDFGIAKSIGDAQVGESTATGALVGSPHYMSPEQARANKQLDHRSDLWSFGVILFRCLTGRLPFPGKQIGDVLVAICADPIPAPSTLVPDLGPEVDRFFARALARDPALRFQSARELAGAFTELAGAPGRSMLSSASGEIPPESSQAAVAAVGFQPPGADGTLSPSGRSFAGAAARRSSVLVPALAGALVLVGLGGAALAFRFRATTTSDPGPEAATAPPGTGHAPAALPAPEPVERAPSVTVAPTASASAPPPSPVRPPAGPANVKPLPGKALTGPAKKGNKDPTFGF